MIVGFVSVIGSFVSGVWVGWVFSGFARYGQPQ